MHEQTPVSNNTNDSILRHWVVGWAKDISASPRIFIKLAIVLIIRLRCSNAFLSQSFNYHLSVVQFMKITHTYPKEIVLLLHTVSIVGTLKCISQKILLEFVELS